MAIVLSPNYSANLASDVYNVTSVITRDDFLEAYKADMEISKAQTPTGVTGAYILNKPHVMAVYAAGKGAYQGQAFAAFKGTANLYDGLTDLNTGVQSSHTGQLVHQGFYRAFDSVLDELQLFVSRLKGVTTLHCVGHSLGGAIATLAADWVKASATVAQVRLYTFGSPRVGLQLFASTCTQRLQAANIFRAYHKTDPVPMVPTWPFFHAPTSDADYLLPSPVCPVPWEYHRMKHYIKSVEKAGSWTKLATYRPKGYGQAAVEAWLASDGLVSFSAHTLDLLNAALLYVVEKVVQATGIALVTGFATTFTLLDRMAMFMAHAAKVSAQTSIWVHHLIRKMGVLIGIVVKKGVDLTVEFIRRVFLQVHQQIAEMIKRIGHDVG
jgi:triacylglycerol lipase